MNEYKDDECERYSDSSINSLPLLAMKKIFKLLSTHDRKSAMQVCIRWRDIINFEVGLTMFVGKGLVYNFPGHKTIKWKPLSLLSKVGVDKCLFGEMIEAETVDYGDDDDKDDHVVEGFMVPDLVKELSFYGKITNELFHVIVAPTLWITTLKIHLTVFRHVSFEKYTLRLYSLAHLRICYTHPVFHLGFPFKDDDLPAKECVHKNITKFLHTCFFRRINTFEFVGPYFVDKTKNLIDTIRVFVIRHHVSLKELILNFPYEWNVERSRINLQMEMRNGLSRPTLPLPKDEGRECDWGNVQLSRLQVVCPATIVPPIHATETYVNLSVSSWSQQSLNDPWEALLGKQYQITSLQYINKYEDWTFPQAIFVNNAHSLKVISLSVNSKFPVDCKTLSCCKNLSRLTLEGNYYQEDDDLDLEGESDEINNDEENYAQRFVVDDGSEGISRLFNVHHLPESLQDICLSKLMIPVSEVEALVDATPESKRLPNLRSLQLYQICKSKPQFGLTLALVQNLLDQSNLSVSFWQALNCTSCEAAISKALNKVIDPEVMTLMKVLEHCDTEEDRVFDENLRFAHLYDCHVQLIRKPKMPTKT